MSDLMGLEEAHDPFEEALERISILIDGVVAQQCARHYGARTQEHQFTSRLAEAIVGELGRFPVEGVQLEVVAQEFPDRGPHSMEKPSGADLYISVAVQSPERKISVDLPAKRNRGRSGCGDDRADNPPRYVA
jgi:hypothetical protein